MEQDAVCSKREIRYKTGRHQTCFFQNGSSITQGERCALTAIKKRSFYRDEFVCLMKPEVTNYDGSYMFWGSEGSANSLGKKQIEE